VALGASLRHALLDDWGTLLTGSVFGLRDINASGNHDQSRDLIGLRFGVSTSPRERWVLSAGLAYSEAKHIDPDQNFIGQLGTEPATTRTDTLRNADVSATWLATKNLSLRFDATHSRNESNIEVYSYRRSTYALKARYEFF
jgi:hypothetical protein